MAKPKSAKRSAKKVAKKATKKTVKRVAKKSAKSVAKKPSTTRRPKRAAAASRKAVVPNLRAGVITHTELASADPPATRAWCQKVLGWKFGQAMSTPTGPYHMWQFENGTGGGIRGNNPPEVPGSIPYCEVGNIHATFSKAVTAGATAMFGPEQIPGGMGWIAIVAAPGGVPIGFWAKD